MSSHFLCTTCAALDSNAPTFGVPLVSPEPGAKMYFIQDVNPYTGRISAFRLLADTDYNSIPLQDHIQISIGDQPIFAFTEDMKTAFAGPVSKIAGRLREVAERFPAKVGLQLQIAELVGSTAEKIKARATMRTRIARQSGEPAANLFYRGALRASLWGKLVSQSPNEKIARDIISQISRVTIDIDSSGDFKIDISALPKEALEPSTIDLILEELRSEFQDISYLQLSLDYTYEHKRDGKFITLGSDVLSPSYLPEIIHDIKQSGTLEERISRLTALILENKQHLPTILEQFKADRSKYVNTALRNLRQLSKSLGSEQSLPDAAIFRAVAQPFYKAMPTSRALLLYYMAQHLSRFRIMNNILQRKLERTQSQYVAPYYDTIQKFLREPPQATLERQPSGEAD